MDLNFPEPPKFYRQALVIAALMGSLGLIPCVGGIVGLFVAAGLTRKFFDGSVLAGGYVAIAMLAGHYALYYTVMVALKTR
jgi:predicted PurR-regulated permease PerM